MPRRKEELSIYGNLQLRADKDINAAMHPEFGIALEEAKDAGVEVLSLKCHVGMDRLEIIG